MARSKIEWTESTWNPITGCTKLSDGCANCYACTMANRLQKMGNFKYRNGFQLTLHESCLTDPLAWKKPSLIFVNSMSDLFHEDVFCIAPEYRGKGVATALLDRVCEDAKTDGYTAVEGYPRLQDKHDPFDYTGPARLYEKAGFSKIAQQGKVVVMRKELGQEL